jgi:tetratricopeptide (TPR) repeat protein
MRKGWRARVVMGITVAAATGDAFGETPARSLSLTRVAAEGERASVDKGALAALEQKVQEQPKDRAARLALVRGLVAAGRLDDALAAARDWRAHDAYNLVAVRSVGDVYAERGERERARRAYSSVVELLPNDARAQRALVGVLKQSGDLAAAYERLTAAAVLAPSDQRLAFERADTAERLGRPQEAAALFRAVVEAREAPESVRHPAKQRLAQLLGVERRRALVGGDAAAGEALLAEIDALGLSGGTVNDIKVYLTWDTDRSDVDLWVLNPGGEKIFYSHKQGKGGDALFDDVTNGYGPESYSARQAAPGRYLVSVNYYGTSRDAFAEARGEVTVVLHEGTAEEQRHVLPYRLHQTGQTVLVAAIEVQ